YFMLEFHGQCIASVPIVFAIRNKIGFFIVLRHCRYIQHGIKIVLHTLYLSFDFLGFFRFCGCVCCVCLVLPDFSFEIASFPLLSASFFLAAFISLSSFRTDGFFGTDGAYSLEVPSAVLSGLTEIGSDRRDFSVFANEGFCCFPSFFIGSPNSSSMILSSCDFSGRSCCGTAGDFPDTSLPSCGCPSLSFPFPVSGPAFPEDVSLFFLWDFSSLLFSISVLICAASVTEA